MKSLRFLITASLLALALAGTNARAADESPFKFEFHGFVTGSLYMQDQTFLLGQGQGLLMAAPFPGAAAPCKTPACEAGTFAAGQATKSGTFLSGDIRQSRFIFAMTGPQAFGGTPKGYFEGDFLGGGGLAGAPGAAPLFESWIPRMRQAYAEIKWGNTTLQAGQYSAQLLLAQIPVSVAHIANPVTFGAGTIGWRPMGFRVMHVLPMDSFKLELAGEIVHSKWNDPGPAINTTTGAVGNTNNPAGVGAGSASGMPQVGGRLKAEGKSGSLDWMGYLAGSYESINLKGFGETAPNGVTLQDGVTTKTSIGSWAGEVGGKVTFLPVTLAVNYYTGKATGPMAGSMLQFGDVADSGYWAQAGFFATKEFSIWGIYGASASNKNDLRLWVANNAANPTLRSDNQMFGGMLQYRDAGYALAAEYYSYNTKYLLGTFAAPAGDKSITGYQAVLSAGYFF